VLPERYFAVQELLDKKSLFEVFSFKQAFVSVRDDGKFLGAKKLSCRNR
jgi:hypothetical protein